ncbi:MAG: hypothetical protein PHG65_05910 [Kiritimatiellae bacterium]|nr:hypothetical protein [Kiritimatiellia bacterium]
MGYTARWTRWFLSVCFLFPVLWCGAVQAVAEEQEAEAEIQLSVMVQEGRIILLWTPPNEAPSDGVKISRALEPDFAPDSLDQYTKWLPGTGYSQCVLFPSAVSDKTYFYRVASVSTGDEAVCLAISNPVKVDAMKKSDKKPEEEDPLFSDAGYEVAP